MVQTQVRNVLEPLSADEIRAAVRILKAEEALPEAQKERRATRRANA